MMPTSGQEKSTLVATPPEYVCVPTCATGGLLLPAIVGDTRVGTSPTDSGGVSSPKLGVAEFSKSRTVTVVLNGRPAPMNTDEFWSVIGGAFTDPFVRVMAANAMLAGLEM